MARPTKLNKQIQNKIVKALKTGATIADVCQHVGIVKSTFYEWLERGEAGDAEFAEFSDAVTRAQADAKVVAIQSLRNAMTPYEQTSKTVDVFTEKRVNVLGREYDYVRKTERETVTTMAGDWRAAVEYLKRRYPDEWSEKRILELGLSADLLSRLEAVAKQANIPASEIFENMINELATQLQDSSTTDTRQE